MRRQSTTMASMRVRQWRRREQPWLALVNSRPAEIVFTSGGTEADNLGIFGLVQRGDHVITSTIEHSAVMNSCKRLEQMGCDVTYVPVNSRGEIYARRCAGWHCARTRG